MEGQARLAAYDCARRARPDLKADYEHRKNTSRSRQHAEIDRVLRAVTVEQITPASVVLAVADWQLASMTASSINCRVSALSSIGVNTEGCRVRKSRELKWWLTPDAEAKLLRWLYERNETVMADYITWATATGLRVEETLRLTRGSFTEDPETKRVSVVVPGLKTALSQATLPLSIRATGVYMSRLADNAAPDALLFDVGYEYLMLRWRECRAFLGQGFNSMVTLKALRRSFARKATSNGMPLDLVRSYLRHERVETTMGYLHLTGGYREEEYRKWL